MVVATDLSGEPRQDSPPGRARGPAVPAAPVGRRDERVRRDHVAAQGGVATRAHVCSGVVIDDGMLTPVQNAGDPDDVGALRLGGRRAPHVDYLREPCRGHRLRGLFRPQYGANLRSAGIGVGSNAASWQNVHYADHA